jgi:putative ABC transport system ATP-binding protein
LLALENIKRSFVNGDVVTDVLKGISFEAEKGEYISIMGPSGSGKSTFLNIIGCLDKPSSGEYYIDGVRVNILDDKKLAFLRNRQLGFVFQTFHLLQNLNAANNVELPLVYRGIAKRERRERAAEALNAVGLKERMSHFPRQMSGGEQQRVAVARALVGNPKIVIADEPTGNLDNKTSMEVFELLLAITKSQNSALLMATHNTFLAHKTDRLLTLSEGTIIED